MRQFISLYDAKARLPALADCAAVGASRRWQLVIRADAVDPGVDLGRVDQPACSDLGTSLGDRFGFAGEPALLVRPAFEAGAVTRNRGIVHVQSIPQVFGNCQRRSSTSHFGRDGPG